MGETETSRLTPSEYYKKIRPEYFSDSEINIEFQMPIEVFSYELSQITTNQKQDEFEVLCRRLAEKLIAPNLIPQTGPTGGGDGKTDSETYPVSNSISDRWFIPENGWNNNEKWAIAISAKKKWKEKVKEDVKKIYSTERGYTKIFFITNQTPSSKQRKDTEEQLKNEFGLEVIILDGKWITEKIYSNNYIELAANSLNLSDTYKTQKRSLGKNDIERIRKLEELEEALVKSNRYDNYDFQMVEDALDAAILSRMLEKPKDEVLGKFDRAFRLGKKVNNKRQWRRIYYQRAWTMFYWFEDYASFIDDYKSLKELISDDTEIENVGLLINLFYLLGVVDTLSTKKEENYEVSLATEKEYVETILKKFIENPDKPCSALIARTHLISIHLMECLLDKNAAGKFFKELSDIFNESEAYPDYPFYTFKTTIQNLGKFIPDNNDFDLLINSLAEKTGKYSSNISSAKTFLKRGAEKLNAKLYNESVIYFGKAVYKLIKAETQDGMYIALMGLAEAYSGLGLIWASNNCLVSAASIAFKSWYKSGKITTRMYDCTRLLAQNELLLGRIPSFLCWYELFDVLSSQLSNSTKQEEPPIQYFLDACLSCRVLNSEVTEEFKVLPDIFLKLDLLNTRLCSLYMLGHLSEIDDDFIGTEIKSVQQKEKYFSQIAGQPFKKQMIGKLSYQSCDKNSISSVILGCGFKIEFDADIQIALFSEMLMAYFESFLATALNDVFPNTENIHITISKVKNASPVMRIEKKSSNSYLLEINSNNLQTASREEVSKEIFKFLVEIFVHNFFIQDHETYLKKVFLNEEVNERLSIILEHSRMTTNVLGMPKLFFKDWFDEKTKKYSLIREQMPDFSDDINNSKTEKNHPYNANHSQRKVYSVIEDELWNKATWQAFGFFVDNNVLGVFLAFKDSEAGQSIFKNWITRFGNVDIKEEIKITIIKGVDKQRPFTYRVNIGSNIDKSNLSEDNLIITTSRFHDLHPQNSDNLDRLIKEFENQKSFRLCPATIVNETKVSPIINLSIKKCQLFIKHAWEIGDHDLDNMAIKKDDNPIIPIDVKDAPILEVLKRLNKT